MKQRMLILGTDHFQKELVTDYAKTEDLPIFSAKKQAEIQEVIKCLADFAPDKIILEYPYEDQNDLSRDYQAYTAGRFTLTANERHQLGFQLAKALNHTDVYAADWNEELSEVPDIFDYAKKQDTSNSTRLFRQLDMLVEGANKKAVDRTIREYLLYLNEDEQIHKNHELYTQLALIGDYPDYLGARWVFHYWYYRNFLIYKNITQLAGAEERILIIYGAGHHYLLRQFTNESGLYEVVPPSEYLEVL